MAEIKNCEGNCDEHFGFVKQVKVYDPRISKDWGEFRYCETAIDADRSAGFVVEDV